MADVHWGQVVGSFLSGGAFGALLKLGYDVYSGRKQPVGYTVDVDRVFSSDGQSRVVRTVAVSHGEHTFHLANLSVARISVVNRGNTDRETFSFGITLDRRHEAVFVEVDSEDRHHEAAVLTPVSPNEPGTSIDIRCSPFNRGDRYLAKIYVHSSKGFALTPDIVKVGTAAPVKMLRATVISETEQMAGTLKLHNAFAALLGYAVCLIVALAGVLALLDRLGLVPMKR